MRRSSTALAASCLVALGLVVGAVAPAGAGLEGTEVQFRVRSSDSDTACVSYYETTKRRGPAKEFDRVSNALVDLPFRTSVSGRTNAKHWALVAWATDDCTSTADPDGTVRCTIRIDGKRKARGSATDAIAFCHS